MGYDGLTFTTKLVSKVENRDIKRICNEAIGRATGHAT